MLVIMMLLEGTGGTVIVDEITDIGDKLIQKIIHVCIFLLGEGIGDIV